MSLFTTSGIWNFNHAIDFCLDFSSAFHRLVCERNVFLLTLHFAYLYWCRANVKAFMTVSECFIFTTLLQKQQTTESPLTSPPSLSVEIYHTNRKGDVKICVLFLLFTTKHVLNKSDSIRFFYWIVMCFIIFYVLPCIIVYLVISLFSYSAFRFRYLLWSRFGRTELKVLWLTSFLISIPTNVTYKLTNDFYLEKAEI